MQNGQRGSPWPLDLAKPILFLLLRRPRDGVSYGYGQVAISVFSVSNLCLSLVLFSEDLIHLVSRDNSHQDNNASEPKFVPALFLSLSA